MQSQPSPADFIARTVLVTGSHRADLILGSLLSVHPQVVLLPKTRGLSALVRRLAADQLLSDPLRAELQAPLPNDGCLAARLVDTPLTMRAAVEDWLRCYRDGAADPANLLVINRGFFPRHCYKVKQALPAARLLLVVRDGRSAVAADLRRQPEQSVEQLSRRWAQRAAQLRDLVRRFPADCFLLHYERLLREPSAVCRELCAFLELSCTDELLAACAANVAAVDDWRAILTPAQVDVVERTAGVELARLGYAPNRHGMAGTRRPPDVAIVSYPKCGRTWLRLLLGRAIALHFGLSNDNLLELEELAAACPAIPFIELTHDGKAAFQTPQELPRSKAEYADRRVVLLIRDLRDVSVSYYFELTHRRRADKAAHYAPLCTSDISSFLRSSHGSVDTMIAFYNIWAENRHIPLDLLLLHYEDLHADTAGQLRRVLDFIGLPQIGADTIQAAVDYARFENMRRLERDDAFHSPRLRPTDRDDPESYKTRRGRVGGFAEYLEPADIAYLEQQLRQLSPFYRRESVSTG